MGADALALVHISTVDIMHALPYAKFIIVHQKQ